MFQDCAKGKPYVTTEDFITYFEGDTEAEMLKQTFIRQFDYDEKKHANFRKFCEIILPKEYNLPTYPEPKTGQYMSSDDLWATVHEHGAPINPKCRLVTMLGLEKEVQNEKKR